MRIRTLVEKCARQESADKSFLIERYIPNYFKEAEVWKFDEVFKIFVNGEDEMDKKNIFDDNEVDDDDGDYDEIGKEIDDNIVSKVVMGFAVLMKHLM